MTVRHDTYRNLAGHYDLHRCDWYAQAFGPRLLDLLKSRGFAEGRILDAGCGTGTLTLLLAEAGYSVAGLDLSEKMLEVARGKDLRGRIAWHQGDVTEFTLPGESFDVVTCVGDTLNHLSDLDEWERAFAAFARHLRPGGALYFDVMTLTGLARLDHYTATDLPDRAMILGFMFEPSSGRSTMKLTSFHRAEGSDLFERASETIPEWGFPVSHILERLERVGFQGAERLWPYADDPEACERLTVLAIRK